MPSQENTARTVPKTSRALSVTKSATLGSPSVFHSSLLRTTKRRKPEWRGVLQGVRKGEVMTARQRAAEYDKQIRPLPPHVVAQKIDAMERRLGTMQRLSATFDKRYQHRPEGDEEEAPAPVSFDPVQLEIDAWGENRRITRCVQLIGARMRFMQSSMDEFTASMGETQHMLKEHLRVADANVSYRERVYMGIDQLQRQTYMNREPSGS